MEHLVEANQLQNFERVKKKYMVTSKEDKRAPGKMKQEYIGDGVVALCPKSYICFRFDGETKLSHKGVQKVKIFLTYDYYLKKIEITRNFFSVKSSNS